MSKLAEYLASPVFTLLELVVITLLAMLIMELLRVHHSEQDRE